MPRLREQELRRLRRTKAQLYEESWGTDPYEGLMDLIGELLPAPWISIDEASLVSPAAIHRGSRSLEAIEDLPLKIKALLHENPVVANAQKGHFVPAVRISDFCSFREFRQTGYYTEIAQPLPGWRDQVAVAVRLPKSSLGFALSRDTPFSQDECALLALFQPHLERVFLRNTIYLSLPVQRPLTPRELEVLHWVAEGKRDQEIAIILHRSDRTIEQHVRACLSKLGVETRSAAVATVWRTRCAAEMAGPSQL